MSDLDQGLGMGFHFSTSQIIASLFFGVIGWYVFLHGKKKVNYPVLFSGVAMMVYPMFTNGPLQDWGIGFLLCGVAYYFNENHNLTG